jgi:hypothetical protein
MSGEGAVFKKSGDDGVDNHHKSRQYAPPYFDRFI